MYIWNDDHEQISCVLGDLDPSGALYEVKVCTVSGLCLCGVVHPPNVTDANQ